MVTVFSRFMFKSPVYRMMSVCACVRENACVKTLSLLDCVFGGEPVNVVSILVTSLGICSEQGYLRI